MSFICKQIKSRRGEVVAYIYSNVWGEEVIKLIVRVMIFDFFLSYCSHKG